MYPFKKFGIGEVKNIIKNEHKVAGESILYILITKPISFYIQRFIPLFVTPNSITWLGFIAMLLSFVFTTIYDSTLNTSSKTLSIFNSIFILIYIFTDSIDGIHARLTKQCSPLGKMLDHFVDSCCLIFCLTSLFSALHIGITKIGFIFLCCFACGFYFALLSEKYTSFLKFSLISGASEGLYSIIFCHFITIYNPKFFKNLFFCNKFINSEDVYNILKVIGIIYVTSGVFTVFFDFYKSKERKSLKYFFIDLFKISSIILLMFPFFYYPINNNFIIFSSILIFSNTFSIVYLEEYLSLLTKKEPESKVYLFSVTFLLLNSLLIISNFKYNIFYYIPMMCSLIHFCLRSGSILNNMAIVLNAKII